MNHLFLQIIDLTNELGANKFCTASLVVWKILARHKQITETYERAKRDLNPHMYENATKGICCVSLLRSIARA